MPIVSREYFQYLSFESGFRVLSGRFFLGGFRREVNYPIIYLSFDFLDIVFNAFQYNPIVILLELNGSV